MELFTVVLFTMFFGAYVSVVLKLSIIWDEVIPIEPPEGSSEAGDENDTLLSFGRKFPDAPLCVGEEDAEDVEGELRDGF